MYALIKPLLFRLDPERAHTLSLKALNLAYRLNLLRVLYKPLVAPVEIMGLHFSNPIGLAAGLDKNGDYIDALAALGFGFIEIGTITPKPQTGNPKPRLFRLVEDEAIINRMGFNNKGIDYAISRLEKIHYRGVLGINIGKNRDTPLDQAIDDYVIGFTRLAKYASYITINISSPNTAGLRDLQQAELLTVLLKTLKKEQANFHQQFKKYVPLVVKIAPDLSKSELATIAEVVKYQKIDGIIATNTTVQRPHLRNPYYQQETGGLSGKPLAPISTNIIAELNTLLQGSIPIIGVGGINDSHSAFEKVKAGATLLQIYSGFIFQGPILIKQLIKGFV